MNSIETTINEDDEFQYLHIRLNGLIRFLDPNLWEGNKKKEKNGDERKNKKKEDEDEEVKYWEEEQVVFRSWKLDKKDWFGCSLDICFNVSSSTFFVY